MIYIVLGVISLLGAVVGFVLLARGEDLGGWLLASTGVVLTAVGLIGFGRAQWQASRSRSRRIAGRDAQAELRRRADEAWGSKEALPEDKRRRAAEEVERRRLDHLRQARLCDLGRIRRAITLELGTLQSPVSLTFRWGHSSGDNEERSCWLEEGELRMRFHHRQQGGAWVWPEGGVPFQQGGRERNPAEPEDVEWAYALFQIERYLVGEHLPSDDQLDLQEPGYYRFGVGVPR